MSLLHRMKLRNFSSIKARREALEKELKVSLQHVGSYSLDDARASTYNCENMVGVAQVPLGVAGPLVIKSAKSQQLKAKSYFIPLATTEGALVASINRGCRAIAESAGATVAVQRIGTTRGPVFKTASIRDGIKLREFVTRYFDTLSQLAVSTSRHLTLTKCNVQLTGNYAFIRFYFNTGDAMGMNMATIATEKMVARIEKETGVPCLSVAGNFDIDKKPAYLNKIAQRGWGVLAEVVIPHTVVKTVLKTTSEKIYEVWLAKCMIGSSFAGSIGFNAQIANVVAALFIATGQDVAHVVEGSLGTTLAEVRGKDLYVSVQLPALMVGTVGGGTPLATQQEALKIMGVAGTGKVAEFASIVGGTVLAGEVSLLASLAEGSLAHSHEKLARGKS